MSSARVIGWSIWDRGLAMKVEESLLQGHLRMWPRKRKVKLHSIYNENCIRLLVTLLRHAQIWNFKGDTILKFSGVTVDRGGFSTPCRTPKIRLIRTAK